MSDLVPLVFFERATQFCEKHTPTGSFRSGCVTCGLIDLSRALSRIDYLLGPPNHMEVSGYDIHCNEQLVVANVKRKLEELTRALQVAAQIASYLREYHPNVANDAIGTVHMGEDEDEPSDDYINRILANGA